MVIAGAYNLIGIQPITFIIRTTCERGIISNISISIYVGFDCINLVLDLGSSLRLIEFANK